MYFSCGQARLSGILYKPTVSILSLLDENNVLGHRLKTGRPELKLQPRPTSPSTSISPVDQAEDQAPRPDPSAQPQTHPQTDLSENHRLQALPHPPPPHTHGDIESVTRKCIFSHGATRHSNFN